MDKEKKRSQITKMRNENEDITIKSIEIEMILWEYYEQLYAKKLNNLDEMDKLLEAQNLPRLNREERENLNKPVTSYKI